MMESKEMHEQLVQIIAAQVLKKLNDFGLGADSCVCKDSYSSGSVEVRDKLKSDILSNEIVIEGIVTARKLEGYDAVKISKNSIITPAARDLIKEKKILVQVVEPASDPVNQKQNEDASWYYWSACSLLKNIEKPNQTGVVINESIITSEEDKTVLAVNELRKLISNGKIKGGILVVKTSAQAVYLASRFPEIRPVVGSFPKTVEEGILQFDANVLILEYAYLGKTAMAEMIRQFTTANRLKISFREGGKR